MCHCAGDAEHLVSHNLLTAPWMSFALSRIDRRGPIIGDGGASQRYFSASNGWRWASRPSSGCVLPGRMDVKDKPDRRVGALAREGKAPGTGASLTRQCLTLQVNPDGDRFADQTGWPSSLEEAHPRKARCLAVKGNQIPGANPARGCHDHHISEAEALGSV